MPAAPDSVGAILLLIVSEVKKHGLDPAMERILRLELAPEDIQKMLTNATLGLATKRNPSAFLMTCSQQYLTRFTKKKCVGTVPMLKRIDAFVGKWSFDEEMEGLLKFKCPCTRVLQWIEQLDKDMGHRNIGNPSAHAKDYLRRQMCDDQRPRSVRARSFSPHRRRDRSRSARAGGDRTRSSVFGQGSGGGSRGAAADRAWGSMKDSQPKPTGSWEETAALRAQITMLQSQIYFYNRIRGEET